MDICNVIFRWQRLGVISRYAEIKQDVVDIVDTNHESKDQHNCILYVMKISLISNEYKLHFILTR